MPLAAVDDTDAYELPSGGSLKLKGGKPKSKSSSHKHHNKKRSHSSHGDNKDNEHRSPNKHHRHHGHRDEGASASHDTRKVSEGGEKAEGSSTADVQGRSEGEEDVRKRRKLTKSEAKFEEARRKRLGQHITKEANMSHKDRVEAFNNHLASLTEHFDMPKIGPG